MNPLIKLLAWIQKSWKIIDSDCHCLLSSSILVLCPCKWCPLQNVKENFPCSFPISLIFVSVTIKRRITSFVFIFPILISVPLKGPICHFLSVLQLNVELLHFLLIDRRAVKFVLLFAPPFLEDCFVQEKMLNYQEICF